MVGNGRVGAVLPDEPADGVVARTRRVYIGRDLACLEGDVGEALVGAGEQEARRGRAGLVALEVEAPDDAVVAVAAGADTKGVRDDDVTAPVVAPPFRHRRLRLSRRLGHQRDQQQQYGGRHS